MLAKYQYMLQVPVSAVSGNKFESLVSLLEFYMDSETKNEDAEKFSAYSLNTLPGKYKSEEVLLYGIEPDSKYVKINFDDTQDKIESGNTEEKKNEGKTDKPADEIKREAQVYIFPRHMQINFCFMKGIRLL